MVVGSAGGRLTLLRDLLFFEKTLSLIFPMVRFIERHPAALVIYGAGHTVHPIRGDARSRHSPASQVLTVKRDKTPNAVEVARAVREAVQAQPQKRSVEEGGP